MKELNKTQALKIDKAELGFYYEYEDDAYSVYGSHTGFCYLYSATLEKAVEVCDDLNN